MPDLPPLRSFIKRAADTVESIPESGVQRKSFAGIPTSGQQQKWTYQIAAGDDDAKHLILSHGSGKLRWKLEPRPEESLGFNAYRLSDPEETDAPNDEQIFSKGTAQIHKTAPHELHATLMDGRKNSTFRMIRVSPGQDGHEHWIMSIKPSKTRSAEEMAGDFIRSVQNHAEINAPVAPVEKLAFIKSAMDKKLRARIAGAHEQVDLSPSEAQIAAGNYRKGHVYIQGLDITIENPKGSIRSGVSKDGKEWQTKMTASYGYIRRTISEADQDHIDVFIGSHPESHIVFVIDQVKPSGQFDECKVIIGTTNEKEARDLYLSNYSKGWKGLGSITSLTIKQFKSWIDNGDTSRPTKGQKFEDFHKKAELAFPSRINNLSTAFQALAYPSQGPVIPGTIAGTAAGAGIGGLGYLFRKAKAKITGREDDSSLGESLGMGAIAGAAIPLGLRTFGNLYGGDREPAPFSYKAASMGTQNILIAIQQDFGLSDFERQELIQQLEQANRSGFSLNPDQLFNAGLGALAGWMASRFLGMGGVGQTISAAAGGLLGYNSAASNGPTYEHGWMHY